MKTVRDICRHLEATLNYQPMIVETGCTYGTPANLADTTTNNLAAVAAFLDGMLVSADINEDHIAFARQFVAGMGLHATFLLGDSVLTLSSLTFSHGLDVLCLDSKEFDEDHMVHEYEAVKHQLNDRHFVLVDDIHNGSSVKFKKMVPMLKDLGYDWREVPTPTGMFVAAKGYDLW